MTEDEEYWNAVEKAVETSTPILLSEEDYEWLCVIITVKSSSADEQLLFDLQRILDSIPSSLF